jgi:hypothetical protein
MSIEPKVFGPAHMRMIELPISEIFVDQSFNCRGAYSAEEIAEASAAFEKQPMLHPPAIARMNDQWQLIAGFLRFAVWEVQRIEVGVFRWVESDDVRELSLTNMAENLLRKDLRPSELVQCITGLRESGVDAAVIAQYCRCTTRWVRRLCALKRSAHPDLWAAFVSGNSSHLTLRRMLDLADHEPAEQLQRWKRMQEAAELADECARGYEEEIKAQQDKPVRRRRRYPARRHAHQVRRLIEHEPTLRPEYRQGALDMLAWFLTGADLPLKVSLSTFGRLRKHGALASAIVSAPKTDGGDPAGE